MDTTRSRRRGVLGASPRSGEQSSAKRINGRGRSMARRLQRRRSATCVTCGGPLPLLHTFRGSNQGVRSPSAEGIDIYNHPRSQPLSQKSPPHSKKFLALSQKSPPLSRKYPVCRSKNVDRESQPSLSLTECSQKVNLERG